jgi:hypothetical protein
LPLLAGVEQATIIEIVEQPAISPSIPQVAEAKIPQPMDVFVAYLLYYIFNQIRNY